MKLGHGKTVAEAVVGAATEVVAAEAAAAEVVAAEVVGAAAAVVVAEADANRKAVPRNSSPFPSGLAGKGDCLIPCAMMSRSHAGKTRVGHRNESLKRISTDHHTIPK